MPNAAAIELTAVEMHILAYLRQYRGSSRNDLAHHLHLSRAKTTQHIEDMIQRGIIKDDLVGKSSGGRKPRLLDIDGAFCYIIGIYMGTTGATIGIADFTGELCLTHRYQFSHRDMPAEILGSIIEQIFALLNENDIALKKVYAVGVGVPAPIDKETGLITSPANLLNWDNFSVVDYFSRYFPDAVVQVDNDVNVMALGEAYHGIGKGHANFIYTKVGTGIGCGIICNGELYRGDNGTAGDIGHVSIDREGPVCYCGNVGCLERIAAAPAMVARAETYARDGQSPALAKLYQARGGYLLPQDIGAAASEGDKYANEIIIHSGQELGRVLATLVSFFTPTLMIIGGGVSDIGPQFVTSVHRTILGYSQPLSTRNLDVRKSEMGRMAGVHGAIILAMRAIFTTQDDI